MALLSWKINGNYKHIMKIITTTSINYCKMGETHLHNIVEKEIIFTFLRSVDGRTSSKVLLESWTA